MLDKRVVIVTGGAGNMGRALTRKYTAMGDAVVMADVNETVGRAFEAELRAAGKEVSFLPVNLGEEAACAALVEQVMERYGRIDVLCNNAAKLSFTTDFLKMSLAEFQDVLNVNLIAAFTLTKLVAVKMIENGTKNGVIINTGSIAGILQDDSAIVYSISKAAIHSLTVCTARQLAANGIRVVAIAPGCMNGIMAKSSMNPGDYPELRELHMKNRVLEHEEVAEVSYFLSTPAASGINGTIVRVDDGYTSFKMATTLLSKP